MNNTKKIVIVLAAIIILNIYIFENTFALTNSEAYAGNQLKILGVLKGYEDGTLRLENNITRAEVATMAVRMKVSEGMIIIGEEKEFVDVNTDNWAYEYVLNAYKLGIINGYPDNSFKPNNNISYAEIVAIMVNLLEEDENLEGEWPSNYINKALEIGIIYNDNLKETDKIVTRGEMAEIVWNTLLVKE